MQRAFDTLDYTKGAEAIGIKREHAEYQAEQMAKIIDSNLTTKNDLFSLESKLKLTIANLEIRLIKWMIGLAISQTALTLTVVGFLSQGH
jgi:hypothetical protein